MSTSSKDLALAFCVLIFETNKTQGVPNEQVLIYAAGLIDKFVDSVKSSVTSQQTQPLQNQNNFQTSSTSNNEQQSFAQPCGGGCTKILTKDARKGQPCGKPFKRGSTQFCSSHDKTGSAPAGGAQNAAPGAPAAFNFQAQPFQPGVPPAGAFRPMASNVPAFNQTSLPSFTQATQPTGIPIVPSYGTIAQPPQFQAQQPNYQQAQQPNGAPNYQQAQVPNGAPNYQQAQVPNGAPNYQQTQAPNGAPNYQQPNTAPNYQQAQQPNTAPNYQQAQQPNTAPNYQQAQQPNTVPNYQQSTPVPNYQQSTPVPNYQHVQQSTPVPNYQQIQPPGSNQQAACQPSQDQTMPNYSPQGVTQLTNALSPQQDLYKVPFYSRVLMNRTLLFTPEPRFKNLVFEESQGTKYYLGMLPNDVTIAETTDSLPDDFEVKLVQKIRLNDEQCEWCAINGIRIPE
jgi:hypothetical protein